MNLAMDKQISQVQRMTLTVPGPGGLSSNGFRRHEHENVFTMKLCIPLA